jgi:arylsulfatase A-like enzyme
MNRRVALAVLAAALALAGVDSTAQPGRPNIIFILADDLGYGELGSYGQTTDPDAAPRPDGRRGHAVHAVLRGSTVCAPSRSVLMTGQHMGRTTVRGNAGAANAWRRRR